MSEVPNNLPTIRRRRQYTARELAKALGVSERTIRRRVAESREDYEQRAQQRRDLVSKLRAESVPYADIANQLGVSVNAAKLIGSRAKRNKP